MPTPRQPLQSTTTPNPRPSRNTDLLLGTLVTTGRKATKGDSTLVRRAQLYRVAGNPSHTQLPNTMNLALDPNETDDGAILYDIPQWSSAGEVNVGTLVEVEVLDGNNLTVTGQVGEPSAGGGGGGTHPNLATHNAMGLATDSEVTGAISSGITTHLSAAHGDLIHEGDSRLTDTRTPTSHAASHNVGGGDAIIFPTHTLDDLTDVAITSPATGHRLSYTGSGWANTAFPSTETVLMFAAPGTAVAWANQPSTLDEFLSRAIHRVKKDLSLVTQARLEVMVSALGASTATIALQYSTDQSTWNYLDGGTGPSVAINGGGLKVSSWVNVTGGAKADVFLRLVGNGGDGAADPSFGNCHVELK